MAQIPDELIRRIKTLEEGLEAARAEKERAAPFLSAKGKVEFDDAVLAEHRKLKSSLARYVLDSRFLVILTVPVVYLVSVPFVLVDLFLILYQAICFPVYGIPKVKRADYFIFDRGRLQYLNFVERINCAYCSYGNGLFAYGREISGRTEQHWCPVKHARHPRALHSRYEHFIDYGDAVQYREQIEAIRHDFEDLRTLTSSGPPTKGHPPGEIR